MHDLFDVTGKRALVTGGSVGIGRACATALALGGAHVAIISRTERFAAKTCRTLQSLGVHSIFLKCDISHHHEVDAMHAAVVREFGGIDIAINNAGAGVERAALDLSQCDAEWMIGINLSSVFWCAQAQARQMIKQSPAGGKIINIASMYATVAGGNCLYNAAKAGVVHLTRSLAAEWGGYNINVNCLSPGWMLTPGNRIDDRLRDRMREITPMGSLMQHGHIYGAILYLASAASDFVTGHNLVVDGGHTVNTYLAPLTRSSPARTTPLDEEAWLADDLDPGDE